MGGLKRSSVCFRSHEWKARFSEVGPESLSSEASPFVHQQMRTVFLN